MANVWGYEIEEWEKQVSHNEYIIAIIFRGTELNDWYSNFRWITRINPFIFDQYDQTRSIIPTIIDGINKRRYEKVSIVSAGHSLGGGLAQQAAYSSDKINTVYAFSPSAVTGYFSVDEGMRETNKNGLNMFRIYEVGEVLGYLRGFMRNLWPLAVRDPKIIELGYNYSEGNAIAEHSMRNLACGLYSTYGNGSTIKIARKI